MTDEQPQETVSGDGIDQSNLEREIVHGALAMARRMGVLEAAIEHRDELLRCYRAVFPGFETVDDTVASVEAFQVHSDLMRLGIWPPKKRRARKAAA